MDFEQFYRGQFKARGGIHFSSFDTSNISPLDGVNLNLNLRLLRPAEIKRLRRRHDVQNGQE